MTTDFNEQTKQVKSKKQTKAKRTTLEEMPDWIYCNFNFNNSQTASFNTIILREKIGQLK